MTDEKPEPTAEVKKTHIIEALESLGYEEIMGSYVKPHEGNIKIVVDLNGGKKGVYFRDGKTDILEDNEDGTLAAVGNIIINAEQGIMPERTESKSEVEVPKPDPKKKQPRPVQSHQQETAKKKQTESITSGVPKTTESVDHYANMKPVKLPEMPELTIDIVKKYINEKVTDEEAYAFIQVCTARHLNPFLRQVYIVKKEFTGTAKIIVGKDGFTELAERNTMNNGFEAGIIVQLQDKTTEDRTGAFYLPSESLVGGWSKVHRKDRDHCFENRVSMKEYNTGKASWAKIPATMIRKTALVQALREAYPAELSGMYDSSEMGVEVEK